MCIRDRCAELIERIRQGLQGTLNVGLEHDTEPVSYTHLTLPTIYSVQISVVA